MHERGGEVVILRVSPYTTFTLTTNQLSPVSPSLCPSHIMLARSVQKATAPLTRAYASVAPSAGSKPSSPSLSEPISVRKAMKRPRG